MKFRLIYISLILFMLSHFGFSQPIDMNIQNGYVAEGYDVVAYFDNIAIEGSDKFVYRYLGHNFKFTSQANLNNFKASPETYRPQYGGYCAWAIADKGQKVSINPKSFEIRDGKLYLFYHNAFANTLKKWQKGNTKKLTSEADKHWEAIKFKKN